jgi:gliding motility-associated protein GldM
MAGGKETPRQKMIGMMYLVLTALLALNVSKSILDAFVAIEENIQKANESEFFRGNEKRSELRETALDKSEADRAAKAARLSLIVDKIDGFTAKRIEEIDNLKIQILKESGEDVAAIGAGHIIVTPYNKKDTPLKPTRMDLDKVAGKDKYDDAMRIVIGEDIKRPTGKGMDLWKSYNSYRKELCETIASYPGGDGQKAFFFKSPEINKYKDQKDLSAQITKAIEASNVNQDDKEAIKKIYSSLTKEEFSSQHEMKNVHWIGKTFDHSPSVAAIASLSSLQKEILSARADAVALIRQRVGGGEYSFNKIMALAYGPELANAGDEIEVQVLMAAYDSDKQPVVTYSGNTVSEVRDGKGFIKTRASGGSEMTLSGNITIRNKSGIPKTMPWEKTVKIMKPSGNVSLPELNVLYRGYPNKVEAVASGYDQTILSGNGVSLTKSGNGWIANPGAGREATITVSGKSSITNKTVSLGTFTFRISKLPDPELYFGSAKSGENGSKSETRLFARYPPEIPLNAGFTVVSWEMSVPGSPVAPPKGQGGQINAAAINLLKQAKPGTVIGFMTEVKGPDNLIRKKGGSFKI